MITAASVDTFAGEERAVVVVAVVGDVAEAEHVAQQTLHRSRVKVVNKCAHRASKQTKKFLRFFLVAMIR